MPQRLESLNIEPRMRGGRAGLMEEGSFAREAEAPQSSSAVADGLQEREERRQAEAFEHQKSLPKDDGRNGGEQRYRPLPPQIYDEPRGSHAWAIVVICLIGLLIGAAAAGWKYGYGPLQRVTQLIMQIPGLQHSAQVAGQRLDGFEQKMSGWTASQNEMRERVTAVEDRVNSGLGRLQKQSAQLASQVSDVTRRVTAQLDERLAPVERRLSGVETGQESQQSRLAKMEEEIAALHQQAAQAQQSAESSAAKVDQQFAALGEQVDGSRRDLDGVSRQLARERIPFDLSRNHPKELAPGVTLTFTKTNPRNQTCDGWLRLADGRILEMHQRGVQQPLTFYNGRQDRAEELVITRVAGNSAAGYLFTPPADSSHAGSGPSADTGSVKGYRSSAGQ